MSKSKLVLKDIEAYFKKRVTPFGNGAKIDCPKKYLGKQVTVVVENDES